MICIKVEWRDNENKRIEGYIGDGACLVPVDGADFRDLHLAVNKFIQSAIISNIMEESRMCFSCVEVDEDEYKKAVSFGIRKWLELDRKRELISEHIKKMTQEERYVLEKQANSEVTTEECIIAKRLGIEMYFLRKD